MAWCMWRCTSSDCPQSSHKRHIIFACTDHQWTFQNISLYNHTFCGFQLGFSPERSYCLLLSMLDHAGWLVCISFHISLWIRTMVIKLTALAVPNTNWTDGFRDLAQLSGPQTSKKKGWRGGFLAGNQVGSFPCLHQACELSSLWLPSWKFNMTL